MWYLVLTNGGTYFQTTDDPLQVYKDNFIEDGWVAYYMENGQFYRADREFIWTPVDTLNIPQ